MDEPALPRKLKRKIFEMHEHVFVLWAHLTTIFVSIQHNVFSNTVLSLLSFIHLCWVGYSKNKFISEVDICKSLSMRKINFPLNFTLCRNVLGAINLYNIYFCLGFYFLVFVFTALCQYCSKEKVVSFVTDWGNILLKFRSSSALGDIFEGVLLTTYYELIFIGINLKPDCIDHFNMHYFYYVHIAITFTILSYIDRNFKVVLVRKPFMM